MNSSADMKLDRLSLKPIKETYLLGHVEHAVHGADLLTCAYARVAIAYV